MNRTRTHRYPLRALWRVASYEDYHSVLFGHALDSYIVLAKESGHELGSALAIGACNREARYLEQYAFERVVLSGITEPDEGVQAVCERDSRFSFEYANAERLPFESASFDLVFCKESLHHLARPVLGMYELLRVCRRAAIVIEPWNCLLVELLARFGVTTRYEHGQQGNQRSRDNYVYRWDRAQLESILRSLYLESDATLDLTIGWMSTRAQVGSARWLQRFASIGGQIASWVPGARGNFSTALITPGGDLPPDPSPNRDIGRVPSALPPTR
jgi:SAM-dependent methyltransferase